MSDDDGLTAWEAAVLILLLAENRDLSNPAMQDVYGFSLTGENRRKLNQLGYVESTKHGRAFVHTLTDAGWARCYEPFHLASPKSKAHGAALSALMGAVLHHLDRTGQSLADFASDHGGAAPQATPQAGGSGRSDAVTDGESAPPDVAAQIRQRYAELAPGRGDWVGLAALRDALAGIDRADLDDALRSLEQEPDVSIVPESNQKVLTPADRDAALVIGGEPKHAIAIGAG